MEPLNDWSNYLCSAPRPDTRHASATYRGRRVSVDVAQDVVREGTCIVVVVAPSHGAGRPQTIEYITDYTRLDEGLRAGFGIARDVVEGLDPQV